MPVLFRGEMGGEGEEMGLEEEEEEEEEGRFHAQ